MNTFDVYEKIDGLHGSNIIDITYKTEYIDIEDECKVKLDQKYQDTYCREDRALVYQLDYVVNTVQLKGSAEKSFKSIFVDIQETPFDKYKYEYAKYITIDYVSNNCVFFPIFSIFKKPHLNTIHIIDNITFTDAYALKMWREYNFGTRKQDLHHIYLIGKLESSRFKNNFIVEQLNSYQDVNRINVQTSIIFVSIHSIKYSQVNNQEYIHFNRFVHVLNHLPHILKKGGYLFLTLKNTNYKISSDLLTFLAYYFKTIHLTKSIYTNNLTYYKFIVCEHYKGFNLSLPSNVNDIYKQSNPVVQKTLEIFTEKTDQVRLQYYQKYKFIVDKYKNGIDISEDIKLLQKITLIKNITLLNILHFEIPLFIIIPKSQWKSIILDIPLFLKCQFKSPANITSTFDNLQQLENDKYKLYLDQTDLGKYYETTIHVKSFELKNIVSKILKKKISQAFLKMTEIINEMKLINTNISTLHICEAPGQFILAFDYYCSKHGIQYDWKANSLNPNHRENIDKYGSDIFDDVYGLIKSNPDRWIWGPDKSGDITKPSVVKELMSSKYDIITSDCGLPLIIDGKYSDMASIWISSCNIILKSLKKGGSCCFKTYMPISDQVSMLYTFYNSFENMYFCKPSLNQQSSEFYIVCINYNSSSNMKPFDKSFIESYIESCQQLNRAQQNLILRRLLFYYYDDHSIDELYKIRFQKYVDNWIRTYL